MADFAAVSADPDHASAARSPGQPGPASRLHFLDGEPLLFDESRQKLYALDRTAAFIWCCLEDGFGIDGAAKRVAEAASLNLAAGRALVADLVQRWREYGLLAGTQDGVNDVASDKPATGSPAAVVTLTPPLSRTVPTERDVTIAGLDLHLSCREPEVAQRVLPLFAHLPAPTGFGRKLRIDIRALRDGYAIFQDSTAVLRVAELPGVGPALKAHLVQLILARPDYRLAVHAGAVARGGRVLLLPGDSGSGKTTLAAALMARGFTYLGDDTVVLEREALRVRPIPFALALKAGSWDLLTRYHRGLAGLPVDCRPDGKVVRYLRPTDVAPGPLPAAWMVFPVWGGRTAPCLAPLGRITALRRFLTGCYASSRGLNSEELAQLMHWLETLECYTLDASDLDAAVGFLDQLCR